MSPNIHLGTLLIADASVSDPVFGKGVMLVIEHDENGTRAINLADGSIPGALKRGGPENPDKVYYVGLTSYRDGGAGVEVVGYSMSNERDMRVVMQLMTSMSQAAVRGVTEPAILLMGDANWAPGQLEEEIAAGVWRPADLPVRKVLAMPQEQRWNNMARLVGPAPDVVQQQPKQLMPAPVKPQGKRFRL